METAIKTLVLGLGNPILTDDGVGIHVVRAAAKPCSQSDVACTEASVGGLRLLEIISGYERVIIVDAIRTADGQPGDIYQLHPNDLRVSLHAGSTHDLSFPNALALGRSLSMPLPQDKDITILAVEVEDVTTFGETCTPHVEAAIPRLTQMVLDQAHSRGVSDCQVPGFRIN